MAYDDGECPSPGELLLASEDTSGASDAIRGHMERCAACRGVLDRTLRSLDRWEQTVVQASQAGAARREARIRMAIRESQESRDPARAAAADAVARAAAGAGQWRALPAAPSGPARPDWRPITATTATAATIAATMVLGLLLVYQSTEADEVIGRAVAREATRATRAAGAGAGGREWLRVQVTPVGAEPVPGCEPVQAVWRGAVLHGDSPKDVGADATGLLRDFFVAPGALVAPPQSSTPPPNPAPQSIPATPPSSATMAVSGATVGLATHFRAWRDRATAPVWRPRDTVTEQSGLLVVRTLSGRGPVDAAELTVQPGTHEMVGVTLTGKSCRVTIEPVAPVPPER